MKKNHVSISFCNSQNISDGLFNCVGEVITRKKYINSFNVLLEYIKKYKNIYIKNNNENQ